MFTASERIAIFIAYLLIYSFFFFFLIRELELKSDINTEQNNRVQK